MSHNEVMLAKLKEAGNSGIASKILVKEFGTKQAVHSTAHMLRKNGHKIKNSNGVYFIESERKKVSNKQKLNVSLSSEDKDTYVEQMRLGYFHTSVAQAVVESYKYAENIRSAL